MYRIGEFSYLCETTLKTLRHYDKINLLKPAQIDYFTGYRYYTDEQVENFKQIKELQKTGFSLKEIKELLERDDPNMLVNKKKLIEKENLEKLEILNKLQNKEKSPIEFIKNEKTTYVLGIFTKLSSRNEFIKTLRKVDKIVKITTFKSYDKVLINFEKGYEEKNFLCFIGRVIPKEELTTFELIASKNKKLIILNDNKTENILHTTITNTDINKAYNDIITYASNNNIQIRGNFQETYTKIYADDKIINQIDIHIEAYDLSIENEDAIKYNKYLQQTLKNIFPKKYIGKWKLCGEITELSKIFDPKKKHYMPDTILKELVLNSDGTTNFNYITWKENYLIINNQGTTTYNSMDIQKKGLRKHLTILINSKETNAHPYKYFYKN